MELLEFVGLASIDPVYFETSYYVQPEPAGEKPYALLFESLKQTGLAGVARIAMHRREHIVIIRGRRRKCQSRVNSSPGGNLNRTVAGIFPQHPAAVV